MIDNFLVKKSKKKNYLIDRSVASTSDSSKSISCDFVMIRCCPYQSKLVL